MGKVLNWFGPVSGILFVVAVVVGRAISGDTGSEPSDSASSVLAELRESADDVRTGAFIAMLGLFVAPLWRRTDLCRPACRPDGFD